MKLIDKDLMIGDWVYRPDCYDKVKEIRENGIIGRDYLRGIISFKELEPIPLTPEILEKNGWEKRPTGYVFYIDGERYDNSLWYIFDSNTFVVNTAEFQIKYVHQLQHALKGCGIDKEIEL